MMKFTGKAFATFLLFLLVYICLNAETKAAVFTVTNLNDSGAGSLRQAILDANAAAGADVINFQAGMTGIINLESALPVLSTSVTINGPGADLLTVQRNSGLNFRIFHITSTVEMVVLNGLTISNGSAPVTSEPGFSTAQGGGIFVAGKLALNNCRVSNNSANAAITEGGGIYNSGFLTVTNSDILNNATISNGNPAGWYQGAGVYNRGTATIDNSTISGSSGFAGASAIHNQSVMRITRSSITNNGAGIITRNFAPASLFIENSTISGNSSVGISHGSGTLEMRNVTVANNQNTGIGTNSVNGDCCRIYNSIAADNGFSDMHGNFTADSGYNLIGRATLTNLVNGQNGNILGTSQAPVNAQLAPLGNYGGRTQTHRLLQTSPAINAGNPIEFPVTDQRGVVRPVGGNSDIGAFEFNLTPHRFLPRGGLNAAYNQTLTAFSNVPEPVFSFAVTDGTLPPGLSLLPQESNAAILTGTPTAAGTFNFTVTASNAGGFTISASYTLTIQTAVSFVGVSGRVLKADGKPVSRAFVLVFDANGNVIKQSFTNPFGYYRLNGVQAGENYSFKVVAKNRRFTPQNITINGELNDFNFIAEP